MLPIKEVVEVHPLEQNCCEVTTHQKDNGHKHQSHHLKSSQDSCCSVDAASSEADDCCSHSHGHEGHAATAVWRQYIPAVISFVMLITGALFEYALKIETFSGYLKLLWYVIAYLPVGVPVFKQACHTILQKDFFNEFTLMVLATLGAFFIGDYAEGVGVMLFYSVGELLQHSAVKRAKGNIKALLDIRPDKATVLTGNGYKVVSPQHVSIGDTIQVKAGEKVPLDGKLLSDESSFNTAALTGESIPRTVRNGESVLAGMLNLGKVIEIEVEKAYADSSISRILEMVQHATARKAKTELLIRRFAKVYTPIVFFLALAITLIPSFIVSDYVFEDWLYRALVFLVISCPCALVISVPLGYFAGIGAASRNGILFKGASYLDLMASVNTVVLDKTGTLTKGVFKVQRIHSLLSDERSFMELAAAVERLSTHPVAKAVVACFDSIGSNKRYQAQHVEEIAGHGIKGTVEGQAIVAGNGKLMKKLGIAYDANIDMLTDAVVIMAVNGQYAGFISIADEVKEDAASAIAELKRQGVRKTVMLSGDKTSVVQAVAHQLNMDAAFGDLLPEDKVRHMDNLQKDSSRVTAFVGDGINDAPVLALSDIGIAMGGMGSDAAIEVADVVIQNDQPSKISTAIAIAKKTKRIVVQNIVLALGIKGLVLLLGAFGIATMWEAVFSDVGVTLLAILNALRLLKNEL